ncbi:MAG: nickel-dependent lactate racemase [Clostridiales Family XIII bacterium]|jgi:hypothetical protein|nr:nickel-dependent lactate racemase [Clostridiales Family XIII bacterium]
MDIYEEMMKTAEIPRFAPIVYDLPSARIEDVPAELLRELYKPGVMDRIKPGDAIAITAGSREIDGIVPILRTIADEVRKVGGKPFIVPAMGSHGGADASRQTLLLGELGINEHSVGAPIRSSVETCRVGTTDDGLEVRVDRYAFESDGIIVVGRIKPHTSFRGEVESGLMKMMAIGLGKPYGAALCHQLGFPAMGENIRKFGTLILKNAPILFGVALIDDSKHRISKIEAIPKEDIPEREPVLLRIAKKRMPAIPFRPIDLLIIDEMGKEYSGTGMDMNITGRSSQLGDTGPAPKRIAVLDLTDHSRGNAAGVNEADVITRRFEEKIDRASLYVNSITVREIDGLRIPAVMENDRLAIKLCIFTILPSVKTEKIRAVWIHNTLQLERMYISEGLLREAQTHEMIRIRGPLREVRFDALGNVREYPKPGSDGPQNR